MIASILSSFTHGQSTTIIRHDVSCIAVIPQTCWYNSVKFDCGLSISCVLAGGKPLDLCSGGLIWSCCVSRDKIHTNLQEPNVGALENASTYKFK